MKQTSNSVKPSTVFILCLLASLLEGADNVSLGLVAPRVLRDLGLQPWQLSLALSASLFGLMLGSFLGGRLADIIGRKRVLVMAMAVLGFFSLITTLAHSLVPLVTIRFLVGLGLGGAFPILIALSSESSNPNKRAFAIGLVYSGNPLGAALLSLLMGMLDANASWRIVFYVGGAATLFIVPFLAWLLPESAAFRQARGAVVESAANVPTAATPKIATVLFGEGRVAPTLLLWGSCAFTLFVVYLLLNWLPSLMVAKGMSGSQSAMISMTLNIGGALGVLAFGAIVDGGHSRRAVIGSYLALLLSLLGLANLSGYSLILIVACSTGFFMLGSQLVLYALASDYYPILSRGTGLGAVVSVGRIGAMLAPVIAGMLLSAGFNATAVLSTAVACVLIAAALAMWLVMRAPHTASTQAAVLRTTH